MPKYLIQLDHGDERTACIRSLHAIEQYGSHLMTNMEWGCKDGVHSGWMIGECEDRQEALLMVPPEMRQEARVVKLNRFTPAEIQDWIEELDG